MSAGSPSDGEGGRQGREIFLLACAQCLFSTATATKFATAALAGRYLAPDEALATLPVGSLYAGSVCAALPASFLMGRIGRRNALITGAAFGLSGGLLAMAAIAARSFPLLVLASFLYGACMAFALHYRFAAAEVASPERRARAIAWVLAGGVVAPFLGPGIARALVGDQDGDVYRLCYALISASSVMAIAVLALLGPVLRRKTGGTGRLPPFPARTILSPGYAVAVSCGVSSYVIMSLMMTALPLAMRAEGFSFSQSTMVLQWHVVGMYLPGLFSGRLIGRFGAGRVIVAGCVLVTAAVVTGHAATDLATFWIALALVGAGWNFLFVGGTFLLVAGCRPEDRFWVQGTNDFLVFTGAGLASLLSGLILSAHGWQGVVLGVVPFLLLVWALCLGGLFRAGAVAGPGVPHRQSPGQPGLTGRD